MSLYADIQKMRQIPQTDETATFVRRRDADAFKPTRKIRKPRPPKNIELFDCDENDCSNQKYNGVSEKFYLNEHEIACSIKEANCGISYSNESLMEKWKARQKEEKKTSLKKNNSKMSSVSDTESCIDTTLERVESDTGKENVERMETVLKKCGLNKNAVIRGLLKNHTISLEDLLLPSDCINTKNKNSTDTQTNSVALPVCSNEENCVKLVPCPENPEVLIQPLQISDIDESKYNNIDFSVPHIGKKKLITSRQFYINADDSDFAFK